MIRRVGNTVEVTFTTVHDEAGNLVRAGYAADDARVAELESLVLRLADRIYAAHEVLANLAEKRPAAGDVR